MSSIPVRRSLSHEELESKLQSWSEGKESGVWLSLDIVLKRCPEVVKADFTNYMKLGEGRDVLLRGFYFHINDRKLHSIFIFNKYQAQLKQFICGPPQAPDVRVWIEFLSLFTNYFERDPDYFYNAAFDSRITRQQVTYTFAEALFDIKLSRMELKRRIEHLIGMGLLPPADPPSPKVTLPPATPTATPTARETRSARRASLQASGVAGNLDLEQGYSSSDDEQAHPHRLEVFALASEAIQNFSDEGHVLALAIEELVLFRFLEDDDLQRLSTEEANQVFSRRINNEVKTWLDKCGPDFPVVFLSDDGKRPPCASHVLTPLPRRLKEPDLAALFYRYMAHTVGRTARSRLLERRVKLLEKIDAFEKTQLFSIRPRNELLFDYLTDRVKYSNNRYSFLYCSNALLREEPGVIPILSSNASRGVASSPSPAKAAMLEKNKYEQMYLSHRAILVLMLMKVSCNISDNSMLILQYLMHYLFTGEVGDPEERKKLCITGGQLTNRARQLQWRLSQYNVERINLSKGVLHFSADDSNLNGIEFASRHVHYFDEETNAPNHYALSNAPSNRKLGEAMANGLLTAAIKENLDMSKTSGATTDNAENAQTGSRLFYQKAEEHVNGLDDDGQVIASIIFGVSKRPLNLGSPLHYLQLHFKHAREQIGGSKTDMNTPCALQLAYKVARVVRSERVSVRGISSTFQQGAAEILGDDFTQLPIDENEGRWGISQRSLEQTKKMMLQKVKMKDVDGTEVEVNGLAAWALTTRDEMPAGKWHIGALVQIAEWSESPEVQVQQEFELELSGHYFQELGWFRGRSSRSYLKHYEPLYRLRELVGHLWQISIPFARRLRDDPMLVVPKTAALMKELFRDDDARFSVWLGRLKSAGKAYYESVHKHCAFVVTEGWAIVLQICTPGIAGAVARRLAVIAPDIIFRGNDDARSRALAAVETHKNNSTDKEWKGIVESCQGDVRHWVQQFGLADESVPDLPNEWQMLCEIECCSPETDRFIHDDFASRLPLLHRALQSNVDVNVSDTLLEEAYFSRFKRICEKTATAAKNDLLMYFDSNVMDKVRKHGTLCGSKHKDSDRAYEIDFNGWNRTHGQCNEIIKYVNTKFVPLFNDESMRDAPRLRADIERGDGLVARDEALAKKWREEHRSLMHRYDRKINLRELKERASRITIEVHAPSAIRCVHRLRCALSYNYSAVLAVELERELLCHLPFFLWAAKCSIDESMWKWREVDVVDITSRETNLWTLIRALVAPPPMTGRAASKSISTIPIKLLEIWRGGTEVPTSATIFDLLNPQRAEGISTADAQFITRFVSTRFELSLEIPAGPVTKDAFTEFLRPLDQTHLLRLTSLLKARRMISEATSSRPCHKSNEGLHKANTVSALQVFTSTASLLFDFLGESASCDTLTLYICSPLSMDISRRQLIGIGPSARLPTTRRLAGREFYESKLKELKHSLNTAADSAFHGSSDA